MLTTIFAFFLGLLGGSFAMISFFKVTINGNVTTQKADTNTCVAELRTVLTTNFSILTQTLDNHFHCVALKTDKAKFLSNKLQNIIISIVMNIIFLISFYYVCFTASKELVMKADAIFNTFFGLAFVCFVVWSLMLIYGVVMIYIIDDFEEMGKISLFKEFKKIKNKF